MLRLLDCHLKILKLQMNGIMQFIETDAALFINKQLIFHCKETAKDDRWATRCSYTVGRDLIIFC